MPMHVGDTINTPEGVNSTNIPVGATVRYKGHPSINGAMPPDWTMEVHMRHGKKVLAFPGTDQFIHGQNGTMTIIDLPRGTHEH